MFLETKTVFVTRVGGIENHIHIITHLHPSVALANLVKDIKLATTSFIKEQKIFPDFTGWQNGYGAFTYSLEAKKNLINYVLNQEEHHAEVTSRDEYIALLRKNEVEFDEQYLP